MFASHVTASDFDLLASWRDDDRDAGSLLFERHARAVTRFFRSKVDGNVEDLVQETFLACVERRDHIEGRSSFRAYMFGVARFKLLEHYRRLQGEPDFAQDSVADLDKSPSRLVLDKQEHRILLRALRRLPVDHQIALELYYWEGFTTPDLAEMLQISPHTARSRLSRARAALRHEVELAADDPRAAVSTLGDLEMWARGLREQVS